MDRRKFFGVAAAVAAASVLPAAAAQSSGGVADVRDFMTADQRAALDAGHNVDVSDAVRRAFASTRQAVYLPPGNCRVQNLSF